MDILTNTLENPDDSNPPLVPFNISLPNLTIITGTNGSGKSRLIQLIAAGNIQFNDTEARKITTSDIQLIKNPGQLVPFNGEDARASTINELMSRANLKIGMQNTHQNNLVKEYFEEIGDYEKALGKAFKLLERKEEPELVDGKPVDLKSKFLADTYRCIRQLRDRDFRISDEDIPHLTVGRFMKKRRHKFSVLVPHSIELLNLFNQWRKNHAENCYDRYKQEYGLGKSEGLTDEEFSQLNGMPPWEFLNVLLEKIGSKLRFVVDKEALYDKEKSFRSLELRDQNGVVFPASGVSTGERIIFLMVLYRYAQEAGSITYKVPRLLLLDELDAHLHPSLNSKLLKLLDEIFIQNGTKVIFATHSPATVSLTPHDAIVVLEPYQEPYITSRRDALNVLMSGQEKMFIDLSESRIVFLEDESDVKIYERLFMKFANSDFDSRLVFKSLSKKNRKGTDGGGKSRVRNIIDLLGTEKNVVGIVDWDTTEKESDCLFVMGEGERYGIENILLDPRILIYIVTRFDTTSWSNSFQFEIEELSDFHSLSDDKIQKAINIIEDILFEKPSRKVSIEYSDSKCFEICEAALYMNCHDYEKLVNDKLKISKKLGRDDICLKICEQIIPEIPGSLPKTFVDTIKRASNL